jgi:regulator of replication initiation timing
MKSDNTQNPNDVLLGMYKEANQMLTDKVKALSLENAKLKSKLSEINVCTT